MSNRNGVTNPFSEIKPEHETDNQAELTPEHVEPTTNKPMVDSMNKEQQSLNPTNQDSDSPLSDHEGQAMEPDDRAYPSFLDPVSPQQRDDQSLHSSFAQSDDVDLAHDAAATDDEMKVNTFEQTPSPFDPLESYGDEDVDPVALAEEADHTDSYDHAFHTAEPQEWEEQDLLTGVAQSEKGKFFADAVVESEEENPFSQEDTLHEPAAAVSKAAKPAAKKKSAQPVAAASKAAKSVVKKKSAKPVAAASKAAKSVVKKKSAKPAATASKVAKPAAKKKSAQPVAAASKAAKSVVKKKSAKPAATASKVAKSVVKKKSAKPAATASKVAKPAAKKKSAQPVAAASKAAKSVVKKKSAKPVAAVSKAAKSVVKKKSAKPVAAASKAAKSVVKKKSAKPVAAASKAAKSVVKKKSAKPAAAVSKAAKSTVKKKTSAPTASSSARKSLAGKVSRATRGVARSSSLGTRSSASTRLASNQARAVGKKTKTVSSARVTLAKGNKPSTRQASSKKTSISAIVSQLVRGGTSRTSPKTKPTRVAAKRQGAALTVARSASRSAPAKQKATKQRVASRTPTTKTARAKRS